MKWVFIFLLATCTEPSGQPISSDDCWESRRTVKKIEQQAGVVTKEANWEYILLPSEAKLFPCNLADSFNSGDSVIFSADLKEIFPNERWAGDPIQLTHIELTTNKIPENEGD